VVNLAIWGEVTPGAIVTKCGLWTDAVDVITCAVGLYDDCRLRGVGVARGVILPSFTDLRYDRVITVFGSRIYNGHDVLRAASY